MAKREFVPKPGQTDYTNIRYCPVVNCVVVYRGKVLLEHRSADIKFHPDRWNGISGFLDDHQTVEDKGREELREELGLKNSQIGSIKRGKVLVQEDKAYRKTWLVFPLLVHIKTDKYTLSWESQDAKWFTPAEVRKLKVVPGFHEVFDQFSKVL